MDEVTLPWNEQLYLNATQKDISKAAKLNISIAYFFHSLPIVKYSHISFY